MMPTPLGVPLALYSFPAFLMAFVFLVMWPRAMAPAGGPARLVLRWGHALVWFLLGLAALTAGYSNLGGQTTARALAIAAVLVYAAFLITLVRARSR